MRKTKEQNKGITLIALIITIIVMLILVAVTITTAVNGGLFNYAGKAVGDTKNAGKAEESFANGGIKVGDTYYNTIDEYINKKISENQEKPRVEPVECTVCSYGYVNSSVDDLCTICGGSCPSDSWTYAHICVYNCPNCGPFKGFEFQGDEPTECPKCEAEITFLRTIGYDGVYCESYGGVGGRTLLF